MQSFCPICGGRLRIIGSRYRSCIREDGERICLALRRLRCRSQGCRKIHHELPDLLVPYKRHVSASIEKIVGLPGDCRLTDVGAETGTFRDWNVWFRGQAGYWRGCLEAIHHRLGRTSAEDAASSSQSALQALHARVGPHPGWLARIVRPVVNAGLWVHTRSEWVTDPP